jgi:hypothetical protein
MSSQIFAGDASGSVTIQCPAVAGTNVLTLPLSNGLIPGEMIYRLNTAVVGLDSAAVQNVLGVGITLNGNTVYQFEAVYAFSKTLGATSHTVAIGFGGTATVNNIAYYQYNHGDSTAFTTVPLAGVVYDSLIQTTAQTVVTGAIASAVQYRIHTIKGTVSIGGAGTFIPQYQLSAAPTGGAYTTQIGSYFKLSPIGVANANTNIGGWA